MKRTAKSLVMKPEFKSQKQKDRTKYSRKGKAKKDYRREIQGNNYSSYKIRNK